jgi:L,D-peptidoglycan transpeptidase YkuD (ErfK/YbiS/YcfS/YnhG family)
VAIKLREGDRITPLGAWQVSCVWARPDRVRLRTRLGRKPKSIGLTDAWCDDPADFRYNTAIQRLTRGDEQLRRPDRLYDMIVVLDWNMAPVVPGAGSAIFLHVWRKARHPTAGCVAFRRDHLLWLLARLGPRSRVVVR